MSHTHPHDDDILETDRSGPPETPAGGPDDRLDPAGRALADALRISFTVLKLVMVGILLVFCWSGFYTIGENEVALQLRFGRVLGTGPDQIRRPRAVPYWKWPHPIDEVIKVPSEKAELGLNVNSFWYYVDPRNREAVKFSHPGIALRFARDGYSLTASAGAAQTIAQPAGRPDIEPAGSPDVSSAALGRVRAPGADYNIVHTQWRLRYTVSNPLRFVERLWDGSDAGWQEVDTFLRNLVCEAVIQVSAHRDIDKIVWGEPLGFSMDVRRRISQRLGDLDVGIKLTDLELLDKTPPMQVKRDFDAAAMAEIDAQKQINQAQARRNEIVNNAEARAKIILAEAQSYHKRLVQAAKADADYLTQVLAKIRQTADQRVAESTPNYREQRQKVFGELLAVTVDQLYQTMLREVIASADEVFVAPPGSGQTTEWRIWFSRDATLGARTEPAAGTTDSQTGDQTGGQTGGSTAPAG